MVRKQTTESINNQHCFALSILCTRITAKLLSHCSSGLEALSFVTSFKHLHNGGTCGGVIGKCDTQMTAPSLSFVI
jgi:hypothetical protein